MNLILANSSYSRHTTNEGEQLQSGLIQSGWTAAGFGYGNNQVDVPTILSEHGPDVVFVQDCRDWRPDSSGCFDKRIAFARWQSLNDCGAKVATVVKDAGSLKEYQREFCRDIGADVAVTYYHDDSVLPLSPWLADYRRVRTYHTIDIDFTRTIRLDGPRIRGTVTGAVSDVYPLRAMAMHYSRSLKIEALPHPGYGANGSHTNQYLKYISRFRTHVATCSRYKFALRKIIESVAVGTIPITDLPAYDVLPEIDEALVRVSPNATVPELKDAIDRAERSWNIERATHFSKKAEWYDYRAMGQRLSAGILNA